MHPSRRRRADNGGVLTDAEVEELRALQARAYGRGADIDGDPVALARLSALERMDAGTRTTWDPASAWSGFAGTPGGPEPDGTAMAPSDEVGPPPSVAVDPAQEHVEADAAADPPPSAPPDAAGRPARRWRRWTVLAVGIPAVVLAFAGGYGVAASLPRPAPEDVAAYVGPLPDKYVPMLSKVLRLQVWDPGWPRLVGLVDGRSVWIGTAASGRYRCVAVVDNDRNPSRCGPAAGTTLADPITLTAPNRFDGSTTTYTIDLGGQPAVSYVITPAAGG
jgi:hypothetical protein